MASGHDSEISLNETANAFPPGTLASARAPPGGGFTPPTGDTAAIDGRGIVADVIPAGTVGRGVGRGRDGAGKEAVLDGMDDIRAGANGGGGGTLTPPGVAATGFRVGLGADASAGG